MNGASERSRIFGVGSGFPFESATISTFGRRGWSRLTAITRPTSPVLSLTMVRGGNTEISARSALMSGVAKSSCLERTISRMASWGGGGGAAAARRAGKDQRRVGVHEADDLRVGMNGPTRQALRKPPAVLAL